MKAVFIEARYKGKVEIDKKTIDKLPEKIGLATTTQFVNQIEDIKKQLESQGKKVFLGKSTQIYPGQLLGCDVRSEINGERDADAFLYIGDGLFHPLGVAYNTGKNVHGYDPIGRKYSLITQKDVEKFKKRKKGAYIKFLSAENIGILVSTKIGQNNFKKAMQLKERLEKEGKKAYIFVQDTMDLSQMENFPFIDSWVNTACPRLEDDKAGIVNIGNIR